jgi:hypothetical protein
VKFCDWNKTSAMKNSVSMDVNISVQFYRVTCVQNNNMAAARTILLQVFINNYNV